MSVDTRVDQVSQEQAQPWVAPSWEEIVTTHSARVFRLAYRLTGNVADAEDLTHETFIRVFRSLDRYQPVTFEGWLHRITTNLFLDSARRKQRIRLLRGQDGSRFIKDQDAGVRRGDRGKAAGVAGHSSAGTEQCRHTSCIRSRSAQGVLYRLQLADPRLVGT